MNQPAKLSHSSANLLLGCERKYWHHKVKSTPRDIDWKNDTLPLDMGSCFHYCLEHSKHDLNGFNAQKLQSAIDEYEFLDFETHGPLLWAMLKKYKVLHETLNCGVSEIEMKISDDNFVGYMDILLKDKRGYWISDIKTAAQVSGFLRARLPKDRQLNLYVSKVLDIYGHEDWTKQLRGCKYRVITKSKTKRKKDEGFKDYADRLFKSIRAVEYEIPLELMDYKAAGEDFENLIKRRNEIWAGAPTSQNYNFCESYFKPCEFWSQCHGRLFSLESKVKEFEA